MDVDTNNQSASTPSNIRPPTTDPRLQRLSTVAQPPLQNNKSSLTAPPGLSPGSQSVNQQNAPTALSASTPTEVNQVDSAEATTDSSLCDCSHILLRLSQLIDSRAALVWRQHERAVVEKVDALLRRNLDQAKALPAAFPGLVDSLQSMADSSPTGLQKLESESAKQQAICSDIAEELRAMLRVAPSFLENDKTATLKAKLKEELRAELQKNGLLPRKL